MLPSNFFTQQLAIQRKILAPIFQDECEIKRIGGVSNSGGIVTQGTRVNVQYNGEDTIPCMMDSARAFQNDKLKYQAVETDNYSIFLPHDVDLRDTDEIIWDGDTFSIRKIDRAGNLDAYIEALLFHTDKVN